MVVAVSTDLKRDTGETKDRLCDRVKLKSVNVLLVPSLRTDLGKYSAIFKTLVHDPLCGPGHQWGIFLQ